MIDNLLSKLLEKVAEEIGGKAASLILDESQLTKRTALDLYRSLRNLEESIANAEHRLSYAFESSWSVERGAHEEVSERLFDKNFVYLFSLELERSRSALRNIDDRVEIYGSRKDMERLWSLLSADSEVMYLLHDNYNNSRMKVHEWKELINHTREAASQARAMISEFIAAKFPL